MLILTVRVSRELSCGVLAQLVERLNGIEEVRGSNPLGSSLRYRRERRLERRNISGGGPFSPCHNCAASHDSAGQPVMGRFAEGQFLDSKVKGGSRHLT